MVTTVTDKTTDSIYSDIEKFKSILGKWPIKYRKKSEYTKEQVDSWFRGSRNDVRILRGLLVDNVNTVSGISQHYDCFDNACSYYQNFIISFKNLRSLKKVDGAEVYYLFDPFDNILDSDEKVKLFLEKTRNVMKLVEESLGFTNCYEIDAFKINDPKIYDSVTMLNNTTFVFTIKQQAISKFGLYYAVKMLRVAFATYDQPLVNNWDDLMNQFKKTSQSWSPSRELEKNYKDLIFFLKYNYDQFCDSYDLVSILYSEKVKHYKSIAEEQIKKQQAEMLKKEAMLKYKTLKERAVKVFSRHPTHDALRGTKVNYRILFRFGSTTPTPEKMKGNYIEINSPEAVNVSSSKILMKQAFDRHLNHEHHAAWRLVQNEDELEDFLDQFDEKTKFVIKSEFGSRNSGNTLCTKEEALSKGKNKLNKGVRFIIEKYYNYSKEYRLHVTAKGCFYTCRKMVRQDTPKEKRWFRNNENSVWILETNPQFEKPSTWKAIENACVLALKATGLDVGACDVIVNKEGKFKICEINSAPSFGDLTLEKYQEIIPTLIQIKTQLV